MFRSQHTSLATTLGLKLRYDVAVVGATSRKNNFFITFCECLSYKEDMERLKEKKWEQLYLWTILLP